MGSWLAAIGTISAVVVALLLARRADSIKLSVAAGLRVIVGGGINHPKECLVISVTNLGERPVIIQSTGWRIGRGRNKRQAIYFPSKSSPSQFGKVIEHGQHAQFVTDFLESPNWMRDFADKMVQDGSEKWLKTLRALVVTSVGHTEIVKPEQPFLDEIQQILKGDSIE